MGSLRHGRGGTYVIFMVPIGVILSHACARCFVPHPKYPSKTPTARPCKAKADDAFDAIVSESDPQTQEVDGNGDEKRDGDGGGNGAKRDGGGNGAKGDGGGSGAKRDGAKRDGGGAGKDGPAAESAGPKESGPSGCQG